MPRLLIGPRLSIGARRQGPLAVPRLHHDVHDEELTGSAQSGSTLHDEEEPLASKVRSALIEAAVDGTLAGKLHQAQVSDDEFVIGTFEDRGKLLAPGASYYDADGIDGVAKVAFVGVSYSIVALSRIDIALETFEIVLNLNLRYRIGDGDHVHYKSAKDRGTLEDVQELADNPRIKVKPPVLEVLYSKHAVFNSWRVINLSRCVDREGRLSWYVTFYVQLRAVCTEEMELSCFPFTRQAMQCHIQCKQSTHSVLFVPFQEQRSQPSWQVDDKTNAFSALPVRLNFLNCHTELGTWDVENHHIAFPPLHYLAPLPSGNKYSRCIITVQCRQRPEFFLWNTVPIVISLPILAAMALFEPVDQVADRASIVFALLLTMATYKVSITSWLPKKRYLTYLDMYILLGFLCIFLTGFTVGLSALAHRHELARRLSSERSWVDVVRRLSTRSSAGRQGAGVGVGGDTIQGSKRGDSSGEVAVNRWEREERVIVFSVMAIWVLTHLRVLCCWRRIYPTWPEVLLQEGEKLKAMKVRLEEDLALQQSITNLVDGDCEDKPLAPDSVC